MIISRRRTCMAISPMTALVDTAAKDHRNRSSTRLMLREPESLIGERKRRRDASDPKPSSKLPMPCLLEMSHFVAILTMVLSLLTVISVHFSKNKCNVRQDLNSLHLPKGVLVTAKETSTM